MSPLKVWKSPFALSVSHCLHFWYYFRVVVTNCKIFVIKCISRIYLFFGRDFEFLRHFDYQILEKFNSQIV